MKVIGGGFKVQYFEVQRGGGVDSIALFKEWLLNDVSIWEGGCNKLFLCLTYPSQVTKDR